MNGNKFLILFGTVMMAATVIAAIFVFMTLDAISGAPEVDVGGVMMNGVTDKQLNDLLTPTVALMVFALICAITISVYGYRNKEL
ncbi:MAG: hypothetical protein FWG19_01565 [Methanomassiliicoccaceae archaeon]|nr:hypothetical protein [Methanomassiliicoccaceae archaeon]